MKRITLASLLLLLATRLPAQAFLHVEVTARELRVREFGTKDGWQTGAWTPQVWKFALDV